MMGASLKHAVRREDVFDMRDEIIGFLRSLSRISVPTRGRPLCSEARNRSMGCRTAAEMISVDNTGWRCHKPRFPQYGFELGYWAGPRQRWSAERTRMARMAFTSIGPGSTNGSMRKIDVAME